MEPLDPHLRRVFQPRQRRALLSFRRRRDLVFFIVCVVGLLVGVISLLSAIAVVKRRPAPPTVTTSPAPAVEPPAPPPLAVPPPTPEVPAAAPAPATPPAAEPPIAETPSRAIEPEPEPAVRPEKREKSTPPRAEKKSEPEKKTEPEKKKKSAKPAVKPADLPRLASPYLLLSNNRPMKIDADTTAEIIAETIVVGGQPALEIRYRMEEGRWVRVSFNTPSDLHGARFVTLTFRGEGNTNAIEFGVVDADGTVASASWSKGTGTPTWSTAEVAVENLSRSGGDGELDWSHVRSMYVRVAKGRSGEGGNGTALVRSVKIF